MALFEVVLVALALALPGEDHYAAGRTAEFAGKFADAERSYALCVQQGGALTPYAEIRRANCLAGGGQAEEALAVLTSLIETQTVGPWTRMLHSEYGRISMGLKRHDIAAASFTSALDLTYPFWALDELRWRAAENDIASPATSERGFAFFRNVVETVGYIKPRRDAAMFLKESSEVSDKLIAAKGLLQSKAYKNAAPLIEEIVTLKNLDSSSAIELRMAQARLRIGQKRVDAGVDELLAIAQELSGTERAREVLLYAVRAVIDVKNFPRALTLVKQLAEEYPKSHQAGEGVWRLASGYDRADSYDQSIEQLTRLVGEFPEHSRAAAALMKMGHLYERSGASGSAYQAYTTLIRDYASSEERVEASYRVGRMALDAGMADEAARRFGEAASQGFASYYGHRAQRWLNDVQDADEVITNYTVAGDDPYVSPIEGKRGSPDSLPETLHNDERYERLRFFAARGYEEAEWEALGLRASLEDSPEQEAILNALGEAGVAYTAIQLAQELKWGVSPEGVRGPDRVRVAFPRAYWTEVMGVANETGVDPFLILAVARRESTYRPSVRSHAGAEGLMQLMPPTAKWLADVESDISRSQARRLSDPRNSLALGAHYLKRMLKRSDGNLIFALASYNAGPGNCDKWRKRFGEVDLELFVERIPFSETRDYVKYVLGYYAAYHSLYEDADQRINIASP